MVLESGEQLAGNLIEACMGGTCVKLLSKQAAGRFEFVYLQLLYGNIRLQG